MHALLKKRLELYKEIEKYLKEQKVNYYIDGNLLINIYNNEDTNSNIHFKVRVCAKELKDIDELTNTEKVVKKFNNAKGKLSYYKYMDRNTLFINLNDGEKSREKGIYIRLELNAKDYENYQTRTINGFEVVVPEALDELMLKNFGLGYRYLREKKESLPKSIVWDDNISYNEYFDVLSNKDQAFDKSAFKKQNEKIKEEEKYKNITDKYRRMVSRTDARFKLLKKYENQKDEILKLSKKKDYKKLSIILKDYLIELKNYYDKNLGLCFDKDIFDVTIDYLKHNNENEFASWLLKNIPEKHLTNIDFTYNDKGVNHENQYDDLDEKHIELINKFDAYCKKHKIIYFGDGGTVLGAIRHGGFIPWDCDIDVVMTYDNYEKLIKAFKKDPIDQMKFVCFENTPNYTIHFGRLYDLNSYRNYFVDSLLTSSYGYHLDIFVLDECQDNKKKARRHYMLQALFGELLNPCSSMYGRDYTKYTEPCNFIMKITGRKLFMKTLHHITYKMNNRKKDNKQYLYRWRKKMYYDKDIFEKQLYVPFENTEVPIPVNYEKYLETQYGESWFAYPLEEDRGESTKIFNLYVPYYMYQDDYLSFINKKEVIKAFKKLKVMKMKRWNINKDVESAKIKYQFYKDLINIKRQYDLNKVNELYNNNEFGTLRKYLKDYYSLQLRGSLRDRNLLFFEKKNFLYQAIYTLIMTGEFYDARKLLKTKKIKTILTDEYEELTKLMDTVKYITKAEEKDKKEAFKNHPYCLNFYTEYYGKMSKNEKEKEVNKFNKIYPNFGEAMLINAKYLIENKKQEEAKKILEQAKDKTRNGFIILEINELLNKQK